jgi:hypothetical protein
MQAIDAGGNLGESHMIAAVAPVVMSGAPMTFNGLRTDRSHPVRAWRMRSAMTPGPLLGRPFRVPGAQPCIHQRPHLRVHAHGLFEAHAAACNDRSPHDGHRPAGGVRHCPSI